MKIEKPERSEYPEWFAAEIDPVKHNDLIEGLNLLCDETIVHLSNLTEHQWMHRYETGKWNLKEVWQHVIDIERILSYRALRYARHDQTLLSGLNEKEYVTNSRAGERDASGLIVEFKAVRQSTILLFESFTAGMLMLRGTTGRSEMTVRAVGYLILGHQTHHNNIMLERYLNQEN